jgi:very-short-patch-repair endonuclease
MKQNELECLRLAAQQQGVVRRNQVLEHLSVSQLRRVLKAGVWVPVLPRVYRVEGAPESWRQKLSAISLWAGKNYAFSHGTAAALLGFRRFAEGPLDVSVTRNVGAPAGVVVHRVDRLTDKDIDTSGDFIVTNATRTLFDLSATVTQKLLRASVEQALQRKWTTVELLEEALERDDCIRGRAALRALVHEFQGGDGPCESELEALVFELIDGSGLPRPDRQRRVFAGGRWRRIDFTFAEYKVILETDGYAYHSSPSSFEKDRERNNSLVARGYIVLHWTWKAIKERPAELIAELASVLASRAPGMAR